MLAKRIIPCLDVRSGRVVKGKKFKNIVDVDNPLTLAKFYCEEGADELVFYDITASHEDRELSIQFIKDIARFIDIPFSVGGGIKSVEDMRKILKYGADKISINSSAVKNPQLIKEGAETFGSQCIVVSVDCKKSSESWNVFINGGRIDTGIDAIRWIKEAVSLGAGEIVLNSIDSDGMKEGYDLELLEKVVNEVSVPVIASGGAGVERHFLEGALSGADGILAASVFHYGEIKISDLKAYLMDEGVAVRI